MPTSRATAAKAPSVEAIARRYLELALLHGMNRMGWSPANRSCCRLTWPARVQQARKAYRPRSGNSWQRGLDHGLTWKKKPVQRIEVATRHPAAPTGAG